jgi:hypothetical protein
VSATGSPVLISAAEPAPFLAFVAGLREATACARAAEWHARLAGEVDLRPLHHLCPPVSPGTAGVRAWQRSYRPGQRYYRRGPGFVVLYDTRQGAPHAEVVLSEPAEVELFGRLHDPGPADLAGPAFARLDDAGALFSLGGMAVLTVGRLRRLILPRNML